MRAHLEMSPRMISATDGFTLGGAFFSSCHDSGQEERALGLVSVPQASHQGWHGPLDWTKRCRHLRDFFAMPDNRGQKLFSPHR